MIMNRCSIASHYLQVLALISLCQLMLSPDADCLDQNQAQQNVGPDLDPNYLTPWWCC